MRRAVQRKGAQGGARSRVSEASDCVHDPAICDPAYSSLLHSWPIVFLNQMDQVVSKGFIATWIICNGEPFSVRAMKLGKSDMSGLSFRFRVFFSNTFQTQMALYIYSLLTHEKKELSVVCSEIAKLLSILLFDGTNNSYLRKVRHVNRSFLGQETLPLSNSC